MGRSQILAMSLALALIASCGGPHVTCGNGTKQVENQCVSVNALPDPLLGTWANGTSPTVTCEFFGNGLWDNSCFIVDGYAVRWERLYENRYVIAASYHSCDTTTAFSADSQSVTLTMFWGKPQAQSYLLTRIR